jgi:hypothetical protein
MIAAGRMGGNMATRLMRGGHTYEFGGHLEKSAAKGGGG